MLQGGQSLPINPFILPAYDEQTINVSAREKAESFASINSKLGVVQKGALTEAIRAAYAKRAGSATPYPDFQDVLEIAAAAYEDDGKKDDSLIEVLARPCPTSTCSGAMAAKARPLTGCRTARC